MKNLFKRIREGFTLIEILIVVVIIGILATVAIPRYYRHLEKGYSSDAKIQMREIYSGAKLYKSKTGDFPSEVDEMDVTGDIDLEP